MKISKDIREFQILSQEDLTAALAALVQFQRRQDRTEHPEGSFDKAGRWYPTDDEDCGITERVRCPSRSWPHSYMLACRTLDHCEDLNGASHSTVLLVKRLLKKAGLEVTGAAGEVSQLLVRLTALHRQEAASAAAPTTSRVRMRT